MEEKQKSRTRRMAVAVLCAVGLLALTIWLFASGLWEKVNSPSEIRAMIDRAGPFAGAAYFLIQLMTVIFAPIPSNVSMLAGALALGFWPALLLGVAAVWLGSVLMFLFARVLGQRAAMRFVSRGAMEKYLPVIREKQEVFLFLAMLFPFFPDDVLCVLAGLTSMPFARFAVIAGAARPWGLAFAALLGSGALSLPWWGWILMTVALGAAFLFALRHSRQIEERLLALISKAEAR